MRAPYKTQSQKIEINIEPARSEQAEHFNSDAHSLDDIMVCGLKQSSGSNTRRKQQEMRLIFELGTLRPSGLNINFNFLSLCFVWRRTPFLSQ